MIVGKQFEELQIKEEKKKEIQREKRKKEKWKSEIRKKERKKNKNNIVRKIKFLKKICLCHVLDFNGSDTQMLKL